MQNFPQRITTEILLQFLPTRTPGIKWFSTLQTEYTSPLYDKLHNHTGELWAFSKNTCKWRLIAKKETHHNYQPKCVYGNWCNIHSSSYDWINFDTYSEWGELTNRGKPYFFPPQFGLKALNMQYVAEKLLSHHNNHQIERVIERFRTMANEQPLDPNQQIYLNLVLCTTIEDLHHQAKQILGLTKDQDQQLELILHRANTI